MSHSEIIWNILASLAVLLGVLASYARTRSERRREHAETRAKLDAVQETVNGNTADLQQRVDHLTGALTDAGLEVPAREPTTEPQSEEK